MAPLRTHLAALTAPYSVFTAAFVVYTCAPLTKSLRLAAFLLLFTTRSQLPFVWVGRVLVWPILKLWLRARLARLGISSRAAANKKRGFAPIHAAFPSVGQSPMGYVTVHTELVDIGSADYNLHLSNSSYGRAADISRSGWIFSALGPLFAFEDIRTLLSSTQFYFFREIPILAEYRMEAKAVAWEGRWLYILVRFLIKPNRKDTALTITSDGKPCSLAAMHIGKICFKVKGRGRQLDIGKSLMLCGFDSDGQVNNYKRAEEMRRNRTNIKWLLADIPTETDEKNGSVKPLTDNGLGYFEERRLKALDLISKVGSGDKQAWRDLDDLVSGYNARN